MSIYTPLEKIYDILKNIEKYIDNNFYIMKIRYIKDKAERQLNLKYDHISIHFYMYISIYASFENFVLS